MRRKSRLPPKPWVYTLGADWSHQPIAVRRSVEELLEWLANRTGETYRPDIDSPLGQFATYRRTGRRRGRRGGANW